MMSVNFFLPIDQEPERIRADKGANRCGRLCVDMDLAGDKTGQQGAENKAETHLMLCETAEKPQNSTQIKQPHECIIRRRGDGI